MKQNPKFVTVVKEKGGSLYCLLPATALKCFDLDLKQNDKVQISISKVAA